LKGLSYDWFGLHEWLDTSLYDINPIYFNGIWEIGYSYWTVATIIIFICYRYLRIRHIAAEQQLNSMGELMASLIVAFSLLWCAVVTIENIEITFLSWTHLPNIVGSENPSLKPETLPASAPAVSVMLASLFWSYVSKKMRNYLIFYSVFGCFLSIVSVSSWPAEIVFGIIVGVFSARFGQWYIKFGKRYVGS